MGIRVGQEGFLERSKRRHGDKYDYLKPRGILVRINSSHSCMSCRGVKKDAASMTTQVLRGTFKDKSKSRQEVSDLLSTPRLIS